MSTPIIIDLRTTAPPPAKRLGFLTDKILMPLAALFTCVFVGHVWGKYRGQGFKDEAGSGGRLKTEREHRRQDCNTCKYSDQGVQPYDQIGVSGHVRFLFQVASKWMMPGLFALLIIVAVRSALLPNAVEGLKFLFVPRFEIFSSFSELSNVMPLQKRPVQRTATQTAAP